jgi:prepilin-type N-terminal cleavage/methylation domain-containing protein
MRPLGPARRAFTLIEMLVVIAIIGLVAAMALSTIRGAAESRRLREAGRTISGMLYRAKSKAVETGRPYGVMLDRMRDSEGTGSVSQDLYYAEMPPPYVGDTADAYATIKSQGTAKLNGCSPEMVQAGDFIAFNYQQPWFRVISGGDTVSFVSTSGPFPPIVPGDTSKVPFQIYRRPKRSLARPVQLPGDIVIDLANSGTGQQAEFGRGNQPVVIMFSPNGSLDKIYLATGEGVAPLSTIYLNIGKNAKRGSENLSDVTNLWVSIGHQSGTVAISPNNVNESGGANLVQARQVARMLQGMGGR